MLLLGLSTATFFYLPDTEKIGDTRTDFFIHQQEIDNHINFTMAFL